MKVKKILFICKHNRFRSKVGEVLFNKLNKNKDFTAFSRGLVLRDYEMYVAPNVKKVLRLFGVKRVDNHPRKLTKKDMKDVYLIVNVANDARLPKSIIGKKKVVSWHIWDTSQEDYFGILWKVFIINMKVMDLIKVLNNTKL